LAISYRTTQPSNKCRQFSHVSIIYPICLYTASLDDLIILRSISKSFYNNVMQYVGFENIWKLAIPKINRKIHFRLLKD
jgi:hypothetical protein